VVSFCRKKHKWAGFKGQ